MLATSLYDANESSGLKRPFLVAAKQTPYVGVNGLLGLRWTSPKFSKTLIINQREIKFSIFLMSAATLLGPNLVAVQMYHVKLINQILTQILWLSFAPLTSLNITCYEPFLFG